MKVVTIEIINEKVLKLFQELEALKLIKLKQIDIKPKEKGSELLRLKGMMSPQPMENVQNQLNNLRSSWE